MALVVEERGFFSLFFFLHRAGHFVFFALPFPGFRFLAGIEVRSRCSFLSFISRHLFLFVIIFITIYLSFNPSSPADIYTTLIPLSFPHHSLSLSLFPHYKHPPGSDLPLFNNRTSSIRSNPLSPKNNRQSRTMQLIASCASSELEPPS